MPDMIKSFLEVDESMKELLLVFQTFFDQHFQVEYLFSCTTPLSENHPLHGLDWVDKCCHNETFLQIPNANSNKQKKSLQIVSPRQDKIFHR